MEITIIPSYGSCSSLLVIETWRYRLAVDMLATARNMSLSDFRKMLRTVCHMAEPEERYEYLKHWYDFLEPCLDISPRAKGKLLAAVRKEADKLPSWILEDCDYE